MRWLIGAVAVLAATIAAEMLTERALLLPAAAATAQWLLRSARAPIGVLILLPLLGAALPRYLSWRRGRPRVEHYTRDKIGGVLWEWEWIAGTASPRPDPICPQCMVAMRVSSQPAPDRGLEASDDRASCGCGYAQDIGRNGNYLEDLFQVEVERRVRIGYWQEALERWGRRGQPVPQRGSAPQSSVNPPTTVSA
jgi:hypothetical protein